MKKVIFLLSIVFSCDQLFSQEQKQPYVQILGVAQDGGYPHFGCVNNCCKLAWTDSINQQYVVSLALVDPIAKKWWLIEATPDVKYQLEYFNKLSNNKYNYLPDGVIITHAHIGHYAGLINFGREVMSTGSIPVYVMPKMKLFIENNGPWSQLVSLNNIAINPLKDNVVQKLTANVSIQPITVPHRDEFSETVGFKIITSKKTYLFIPDIDKWKKWSVSIIAQVKTVDIAFLDATFYSSQELKNRNMNEVPHPFVEESITLFDGESKEFKSKIHFIHFNHTNPLLWDKHVKDTVIQKGYNVSVQGGKH